MAISRRIKDNLVHAGAHKCNDDTSDFDGEKCEPWYNRESPFGGVALWVDVVTLLVTLAPVLATMYMVWDGIHVTPLAAELDAPARPDHSSAVTRASGRQASCPPNNSSCVSCCCNYSG